MGAVVMVNGDNGRWVEVAVACSLVKKMVRIEGGKCLAIWLGGVLGWAESKRETLEDRCCGDGDRD